MSKFKVGDRVSCYSAIAGIEKGHVTSIEDGTGFLLIDRPEEVLRAHPKQCRKLVKKKRREVFMRCTVPGEGYTNIQEIWKGMTPGERITFREVKS